MKTTHSNKSRRSAFTILEILVVLGIASLMGALVLGGFSSFQGSQRRSNCQSNMAQIFRACRLYANDNGSFPPTYAVSGQTQLSGGLGLLWAQRDTTTGGTGLKQPEELISYLKSSSVLHCPADTGKDANGVDIPQTPFNSSTTDSRQVNLAYLSYQKPDPIDGTESYQPLRTKDTGLTDGFRDFPRQLFHYDINNHYIPLPVATDTVITWCPFHRGAGASISGGRPDNVLFFDGSVRRMEIVQSAGCSIGRGDATGWHRLANCISSATPVPQNSEGAALAQ